jgi:hypothetical protein
MANPWSQVPATGFDPVRFVPPNRQQTILAFQADSISVAAHKKTSLGNGFTNHWCLYLRTSQNASVRIDCQPSYSVPSTVIPGGSKAFVIISELPYALSHDAVKDVSLAVRPGLTVAHVVNSLIASGRHKYEFNQQGVGCRNWVTDQVNILQEQQCAVDGVQCETARQAILKLWPDGTQLALDAGAYYQ